MSQPIKLKRTTRDAYEKALRDCKLFDIPIKPRGRPESYLPLDKIDVGMKIITEMTDRGVIKRIRKMYPNDEKRFRIRTDGPFVIIWRVE